MFMHRHRLMICVLALTSTAASPAYAQDDVADVVSHERLVGGDENKRYFLIEPKPTDDAEEKSHGLIVILPGGDGSAAFHSFIKRMFKHAVPAGYVVAQPIAVQWNPQQQVVWPTAADRVRGKKFNTERFIEVVIADVTTQYELDEHRIFCLGWSSSGPALYATSLQPKTAVKGCYIAMSVFKPQSLPPLSRAKGKAYFLDHSPQDRVCPFRMAEQARDELQKRGATIKLVTYEGGHGWHGNIYARIQKGIAWLEEAAAPEPTDPADSE